MDPFRVFAGYASAHIGPGLVASSVAGMTADLARARLGGPLAGVYTATLPTPDEVDQILDALAAAPQTVAELLARFPPARHFFL
jgi:hypothetical protein